MKLFRRNNITVANSFIYIFVRPICHIEKNLSLFPGGSPVVFVKRARSKHFEELEENIRKYEQFKERIKNMIQQESVKFSVRT